MNRKGFLIGSISAFTLIVIWQGASIFMASPFILPSPVSVARDSLVLFRSPSFASMLAVTCTRGLLAFSISLAFSLVLGFACGIFPSFSAALRPWMTTIKATPVVSIILIALLWFGSSTVPVFVAVLMTLPIMTEAIAQGARSSNRKLLEMAGAYHLSRRDIFFSIHVPSAMPFFLGGAGASLGLTWKVVVAGEILSSPRLGIGSAMQTAKIHLETPRVFSLTLTAIALSIVTELLFDLLVYLSRRFAKQDGIA